MNNKQRDNVKKIDKEHQIDLLAIANKMLQSSDASECNQCHGNCNDCGYDR